jgi:hypothetical protein
MINSLILNRSFVRGKIVYDIYGSMFGGRGIKELVNAFSLFTQNYAGYKMELIGPFLSANYNEEVHVKVER